MLVEITECCWIVCLLIYAMNLVYGLFDEKRADEIVNVVRSVKENAMVKIG